MRSDLILAIDQGTTNSKAVLIDAEGRILRKSAQPVGIAYPRPGWVEQDPREILASVLKAAVDCVGQERARIACIGIANQRESVVAWHAVSGEPLGPAITWQCRRTSDFCDRLREAGHGPALLAKTGLPIDPLFPASKARWLIRDIKERRPQLDRDDIRLGTIDAWLLHCLTQGAVHACDQSNAARTQLFDIRHGQWDDDLLALFDVPRAALPDVRPSDARYGVVAPGVGGLAGLPVQALVGDSHAALFAQGATSPGMVKATYGTGSSIMTPLADFVLPSGGIATTIAWALGTRRIYALEGNIAVSASAFPWAAELMGLGKDPAKLALLAAQAPDTQGVYFVPALTGLGAPHWDSEARGLFAGMTFNTGQPELARAVFESVPYQICDVVAAMARQAGLPFREIFVDGGASANDWLMQFQADMLGLPVARAGLSEASALGAGLIAGIGAGLWPDETATAALVGERSRLVPALAEDRRNALVAGWHAAVARAAQTLTSGGPGSDMVA
jgi:glycerol kinase